MTQQYSTEFLYFPLNQGALPAGFTGKPKFNISTWDYLDDKVRCIENPTDFCTQQSASPSEAIHSSALILQI